MQENIEKLEIELSRRLYQLYLEKFNGNKSAFARASNCTEGTIRRVFKNKQSVTINLLLRMCSALNISASEILKNLSIEDD